MARKDKLTITKLVNEPFFVSCAANLSAPNGTQAAIISSIDEVRLERRVTTNPETWEVAIPYSGNFANLQILADDDYPDAMIGGQINADPDTDPPPGEDYLLVIEATITFVSEYGGNSIGKVFRRQARIAYGGTTAPYSA